MKKLFLLAFFLLIISCKQKQETNVSAVPSIALGKQLFETNNCTACHQINQKIVGPSLQNMALVYNQKKGELVSFLKGEAEAIVVPEQYESMKINLEITKTMPDNDLKSLELYILSNAK